jgi:hypothetical protein
MCSERARLHTFKDWPKIENTLATPASLARAGLFYQPIPSPGPASPGVASPKIIGMDRCVCFKCKAVFLSWETLSNPWYF